MSLSLVLLCVGPDLAIQLHKIRRRYKVCSHTQATGSLNRNRSELCLTEI